MGHQMRVVSSKIAIFASCIYETKVIVSECVLFPQWLFIDMEQMTLNDFE